MKKYRKKPNIHHEAFKFGFDPIPNWFMTAISCLGIKIYPTKGFMEIETAEGIMKVNKGDYIIQGISGEIYPCKPDIFESTYDEVTDQ